ncbi:putative metal-sulfur cluster biosynthetic enzyme [Thiomonas sp. X19]|uniref:putative Fe-S cluster assembly protein SufT n=1 Tax=Thiomonas sp. X19 TaxID=1050370 RepID=UPI000B6A0FF8|nr:putative Fe-S cluster assembly protein SufT [Thiomonas sp. X19]SCC91737.1 putative metal-sulfur cluster biosynthetic enzyme [Thiomonas sp. X19]
MSDEPVGKTLTLTRDTPATLVPLGTTGVLLKDTEVRITQRLGSHITVVSDGRMYRIDGVHADALGLIDAQSERLPAPTTREEAENAVIEQLATCYDPEIPINIVELGLVYRCEVQAADESGIGWKVDIDMTLTAPGCGMGSILTQEVHDKLSRIPGIEQINVELVWDPPWSLERMSEGARLQAGLW